MVLTAGKAERKVKYHHSGYPGGLTATRYTELLADRPDEVVRDAVRGMLPKTRLGRQQAAKLKVYAGPDHPHAGPAAAAARDPRRPPAVVRPERRLSRTAAADPTRPDPTKPEEREDSDVATAAPTCQTTGRRKRAVARVRFRPGQGAITVNAHSFEEYFTSATHRMIVTEPLRLTGTAESWDIDVTIDGGGISGSGRCVPARDRPGALRGGSGAPHRPQEGRLPHPRRPREGVEEVRPEEGPEGAPVLEALSR